MRARGEIDMCSGDGCPLACGCLRAVVWRLERLAGREPWSYYPLPYDRERRECAKKLQKTV